jgi:hypothetical protein
MLLVVALFGKAGVFLRVLSLVGEVGRAFTGRYAGEWLREKSERESVSEYRGGKRAKRR